MIKYNRQIFQKFKYFTVNFKINWVEQQISRTRVKRGLIDYNDLKKRAEATAYKTIDFKDPEWRNQWYLVSV